MLTCLSPFILLLFSSQYLNINLLLFGTQAAILGVICISQNKTTSLDVADLRMRMFFLVLHYQTIYLMTFADFKHENLLILWLHNDSQSTVSLVIVCS
jgi:hypothetical protein